MKVGEVWFFNTNNKNENQFVIIIKGLYSCPAHEIEDENPTREGELYERNLSTPKEIEERLHIPSVEICKCDLYFSHQRGLGHELHKTSRWIKRRMRRVE